MIKVVISPWLIICAFLIALFLALGKRRHELILLGEKAKTHRKILSGYSIQMLDQMINIITATLIMSYSLYTFLYTYPDLDKTPYMMLTIPFVIYGLFRYQFLIQVTNLGDEPEMLFMDKGMLINMGLWTLLVVLILFGFPEMVIGFVNGT